jgi:SAM-dependent methyltransferase
MDRQSIDQHNIEIQKNLKSWENKPLLREIYGEFYKKIHGYVDYSIDGKIVELGSGIGNIKIEIPDAISTDLFENPWIDQVENAYQLSFADNSVSNLILFDVFHHFEYPGNALSEFYRVLKPKGRVIIFDPSISMVGYLIYGLFHHEPVAITKKIRWKADVPFDAWTAPYYAAQGNAERVFFGINYLENLGEWNIIEKKKYSALTYVLSGGYSKPQLFSSKSFSKIKALEKRLDHLPRIFSTRLLVVLQKREQQSSGS